MDQSSSFPKPTAGSSTRPSYVESRLFPGWYQFLPYTPSHQTPFQSLGACQLPTQTPGASQLLSQTPGASQLLKVSQKRAGKQPVRSKRSKAVVGEDVVIGEEEEIVQGEIGPSSRVVIEWTDRMEARFVYALQNVTDTSRRRQGGLKESIWHEIVDRVKEVAPMSTRSLLNVDRCKNKYNNLRRDTAIWQSLKSQPNWSINEISGCPEADEELMDEYFRTHSRAARFRHTPLGHYGALEQIFYGIGAKGEFAKGLDSSILAKSASRSTSATKRFQRRDHHTEKLLLRRSAAEESNRILERQIAVLERQNTVLERQTAIEAAADLIFGAEFELTDLERGLVAEQLSTESKAQMFLRAPRGIRLIMISRWLGGA